MLNLNESLMLVVGPSQRQPPTWKPSAKTVASALNTAQRQDPSSFRVMYTVSHILNIVTPYSCADGYR